MFFLLIAGVVSCSCLGTWLLRRYALARSIIDVPNARSSHSVPTPRGGGVAIVVSYLALLPVLVALDAVSLPPALAIAGGGAGIAMLGFLDDHGHIAARWRLLGHFIAAAWVLFWLGGLPTLEILGLSVESGWVLNTLALFYIVWLLNLYNFMDGIDGIASLEAITSCVMACMIFWGLGYQQLVAAPLFLAAAVVGFLVWNFPPAKIFMGDAGSGFLGIVLAVLSLQAAWISPDLFWAWLVLLGVFIVDATVTLIRRLMRGEKVYEAHRSHAYQFAARGIGRHLPVTLWVCAINIIWLAPVAWSVASGFIDGVTGLVVAYMPLVFLAVKFRAGQAELT
ncbi:glycosyltransferase family 4 protein [Pseudomonas alkylphenolica]|uniref:MraY family glycosyltransferase n=1 Tax=Pseudomonas alkylphenolica TaxID=237609 RepID=UPI003396C70B